MQVTWVHGKGARDTELSFDDFEDVVDEMDAEVGFDEAQTERLLELADEGSDKEVFVYIDEDGQIQWSTSRRVAVNALAEIDHDADEDGDFTE